MASSPTISAYPGGNLHHRHGDPEKSPPTTSPLSPVSSVSTLLTTPTPNRRLLPRHIQLIGIGGTIGTALYVQIGSGLLKGGPASLFIAFSLWCAVILLVNSALSELVTYMPISSPFIRLAGRYVDEAFGVAAGWNFFLLEASLVPFEVVACHLILTYWTTGVPVWAVCVFVLCTYAAINLVGVRWYGEMEFWLSLGKVILIVGLILFTFVTMLGGNPQRDPYGFRFWKNPGAFAPYLYDGALGYFLGFLACLIQASFTIAGPDYVAMTAGEAVTPRRTLPKAFNAVFYRLTTFFAIGSLCVGIVVPHNDGNLVDAFAEGRPGAAASPYVIAMDRMRIRVLPHIVNALILTSAFSAGNSYVYCASRSLYGLALEGKAPRILKRCMSNGVPVYCVLVVLSIGLLSFLNVSNSASVVLSWFVSLVTASQLLNYAAVCFTFTRWRKALSAQGVPLSSLPVKGPLMPGGAWVAMTCCLTMACVGGYTVFLPGRWDTPSFLFSYTMLVVFPAIWIGWKVVYKTKMIPPHEVDLQGEEGERKGFEKADEEGRDQKLSWWERVWGG